jgi:hypothetical protein
MRPALPFLAVVLTMAFSGCMGYHVGPTNGLAAGQKSLRIHPFVNQTMEPRLGDAVMTAVRRSLQNDGTYRLATREGGANIVVEGTLTRYDRHALSFVPSDVLTVRDYRVSVTAQVIARDLDTGKVIFDRALTGYTLVRVGSDVTSAERQALPLLGDELAKKITALLVDGGW